MWENPDIPQVCQILIWFPESRCQSRGICSFPAMSIKFVLEKMLEEFYAILSFILSLKSVPVFFS